MRAKIAMLTSCGLILLGLSVAFAETKAKSQPAAKPAAGAAKTDAAKHADAHGECPHAKDPTASCGGCPHDKAAQTTAAADPKPAPAAAKPPKAFDKAPAVGTKATCAVTGEEFSVTKDTVSAQHKGKTYVFCCPGCKPKFEASPDKYAK